MVDEIEATSSSIFSSSSANVTINYLFLLIGSSIVSLTGSSSSPPFGFSSSSTMSWQSKKFPPPSSNSSLSSGGQRSPTGRWSPQRFPCSDRARAGGTGTVLVSRKVIEAEKPLLTKISLIVSFMMLRLRSGW